MAMNPITKSMLVCIVCPVVFGPIAHVIFGLPMNVVIGYVVGSWGGAPRPPARDEGQPSAPERGDVTPTPPQPPPGVTFEGVEPGLAGVLVHVANRSGQPGLAESTAALLTGMGYKVVLVDEAARTPWRYSYVFHRRGLDEQAGALGSAAFKDKEHRIVLYDLKAADVVVVLGQDLAGSGK